MEINKNLVKGSLILLIAFNIYNALNFFFNFSMVRMLSVIEYGILASLYSIIYVLAVFTESIQTVITKYTTKEENKGKLKNILKRGLKKSFFVSLIIFIFYIAISIPLSNVMKISYPLMVLNGLMIILAFLTPVTRGVLQGKKRFNILGINMISEASTKFILALFFVMIGWAVYGAILGTIIGVSISFILSFFSLRDVMKEKEENADTSGIYGYTKPTLFIIFVILAFYSIDIPIARIFFPAEIAGAYAIASILAKTIFFGTQPISRAMFPLSAENSKEKSKSDNVFMNALAIFCIGIIIALTLFYFFPELILRIFSGKELVDSSRILFYLGIAISLISFANLVLLHKLSLGKVKGYGYLLIFLILEIFLLGWFSKDLMQFSIAFVTASAAFLWGSVVLISE